jgi:putative membrane-bound dehydrogenase-like protein
MVLPWHGAEPLTPTGPKAEKRFPPLRLLRGFKATLFACDPMIEYPSVIALGPRPGSLFVAVDYMTGLGPDIVRRDEIRLLEDTDGDGYADKATVFASGFNSIQGLTCHNGTLYVMHAPYLSAVRDGKRRDLLTGLGLAPETDQIRLHNANGVVAGHDGWLYLALGDHGCDVKRPEGDRLVLHGGGILRCRPDGTDLHVFSTGLRNIYDVALDEDLNVFVRDNENDGGDYKIRVCHSFFGADHGYPYLYYERPDEALPPLADLGLGSSAGGLCYLESQFPPEYRGNLFFCEWGRAVVRYPLRRSGSAFAQPKEIDFASGAPDDPYGFKPTDLIVDRDGSMFVSDWADGQRPKRGRGRIYQIRHTPAKQRQPETDQIGLLNSDSSIERCEAQRKFEESGKVFDWKSLNVRGRLHAVWILAKSEGAVEKLFDLAKNESDPRVQAQAIRALADLTDPVLVRHRLDAAPADAKLANRFAALAANRDRQVLLEVIAALGRLRWSGAPDWLHDHLKQPDAALAHAAQQTLWRSGNWPAVLKWLDGGSTDPLRVIASRAVAGQYEPVVVDGLLDRLKKEPNAECRREYADALTRVWRKPATPWTYWGFRPPPRPANSVVWERTEAIEYALDRVLADADRSVRLATLRRMQREKIPAKTDTLTRWLAEESRADAVPMLLAALGEHPGEEVRRHLEKVFRNRTHTTANRLLAVRLFLQRLDSRSEEKLPLVVENIEDGPILAELLRAIGKRPSLRSARSMLLEKLKSTHAEVRARAVEALAELEVRESHEPIHKLLTDPDARVRAAAALAAGRLALRPAADELLKLARDASADVRRASLDSLRRLREVRAYPIVLAALDDPETTLQALDYLGELGNPEQAARVSELVRRQPSVDVLAAAGKVLLGWASKPGLGPVHQKAIADALAGIHGSSGTLLAWWLRGPVPLDEASSLSTRIAAGEPLWAEWGLALSTGLDSRIRLGPPKQERAWLGYTEINVTAAERVDFFAASSGLMTVCLNGKEVYRRDKPGVIGPYPDRFEAPLVKGRNRVLVYLTGVKGTAEFQLRFRRRSGTPERERYALAALSRAGNPAAGRAVFLAAEKSLCIKCHRVGDQGERVGPELTGLGNRFAKAYIVESVLEPSRSIAPSFETIGIVLKSGKTLSGVKVAETETTITLVDSEGKKNEIARADIEEQTKSPISTMPEGLEKRLTEDEFVDLVSFLVNLKER